MGSGCSIHIHHREDAYRQRDPEAPEDPGGEEDPESKKDPETPKRERVGTITSSLVVPVIKVGLYHLGSYLF